MNASNLNLGSRDILRIHLPTRRGQVLTLKVVCPTLAFRSQQLDPLEDFAFHGFVTRIPGGIKLGHILYLAALDTFCSNKLKIYTSQELYQGSSTYHVICVDSIAWVSRHNSRVLGNNLGY